MLVAGCLLAMAAAFAPRVVLIIMWIVGPRVNEAFDTFIVPLLGLVFLPYTTIMYVLVWNPVGGVHGWDWLWIALGVWLDVMKWGRVVQSRKDIPGYPEETKEAVPEKPAPAPVQVSPADEVEKLAELHDQGVLTDEEFEAKKKQVLGL